MDILYIPGLDGGGGGGGGGGAGRYRLLRKTPENGTVVLADKAVTRVEQQTGDALRLVLPPAVAGECRDFFVRLVFGGDIVPEVTFAPPPGETVSYEGVTDSAFRCDPGVNLFAFTETDAGVFAVNRRSADIDILVEFDARGGNVRPETSVFRLGSAYGVLPVPTCSGKSFLGWYTDPTDGGKVVADDTCRQSVRTLYAHWGPYVDVFAAAICPAGNLAFTSGGDVPWSVDAAVCSSPPGAARSGEIDDDGTSWIETKVSGRGTLAFKYKLSCEESYDFLNVSVDGVRVLHYSGETGWKSALLDVSGTGQHVVRFSYEKDESDREGEDCVWIDDLVWTPRG